MRGQDRDTAAREYSETRGDGAAREIAFDGGHGDPVSDLATWAETLESGGTADVDGSRLAARVDEELTENPIRQDELAEHAPALISALDGADRETREHIYAVLAAIHRQGSPPQSMDFAAVADGLDADADGIRRAAFEMLVDRLWADADLAREHFGALVDALDADDPVVRGHAVRGLTRIDAYGEGMYAVEADMSDQVREHLPALVDALDGVPAAPAANAASRFHEELLADHRDAADALVPQLVETLSADTLFPRLNGCITLAMFAAADPALVADHLDAIADSPGVAALLDNWTAQDDEVKIVCSELFVRLAETAPDALADHAPAMAEALRDERADVRENLTAALETIGEARPDALGFETKFHQWLWTRQAGEESTLDPAEFADEAGEHAEEIRGFTDQLADLLADDEAEERAAIATMFDEITTEFHGEGALHVDELAPHLDDDDPEVRRGVANTLLHTAWSNFGGYVRFESHIDTIVDALEDPDDDVRNAAFRTLFNTALADPEPIEAYVPDIAAAVDDLSLYCKAATVAQWGETLGQEYPETAADQISALVMGVDDPMEVVRFNSFLGLANLVETHGDAVGQQVPRIAESDALPEVLAQFEGQPADNQRPITDLLVLVSAAHPEALVDHPEATVDHLDVLAPYRDAADDRLQENVTRIFEHVGEEFPDAVANADSE